MKIKCSLIIAMLAIGGFGISHADVTRLTLSGDFERTGQQGQFVYQQNETGLLIDYYSSSLAKKLTFSVSKFDDCSVMGMYAIPHSHQIAIDGGCPSQGGQIYKYIYEWKAKYSNWCLVREIRGEKADQTTGRVAPSEHVARVLGCIQIGAEGPYQYESVASTVADINDELKEFRDAKIDKFRLKDYVRSLPSYSVSEFVQFINDVNVREINDLMFLLSENGRSYEAIPVLEAIVEKYSDRVVAKLNLADAYWYNKLPQQAAALYAEYYSDMSCRGLEWEVPSRVLGRMRGSLKR